MSNARTKRLNESQNPIINGNIADDLHKIILPQNTTANLAQITPKDIGSIAYDTTLNQVVVNNGSSFSPVAGGGSGTVTSVATGTGLSGGPITTAGTVSLANTAVTPGSYTLSNVTVNAQGQLTSASNGSAVTSVTAGTGLSGGTITSSGTVALANTAVSPGSYTSANITVDAQGRLTAAANGSGGGLTPVNASYHDESGQTIVSGSTTTFIYHTAYFDTNSAYNTSTGTYTIPTTGNYSFFASIFTSTFTLGLTEAIGLHVNQNGTSRLYGEVNGTGGNNDFTVSVDGAFPCTAGDLITVTYFNDSATAPTSSIAVGSSNFVVNRIS